MNRIKMEGCATNHADEAPCPKSLPASVPRAGNKPRANSKGYRLARIPYTAMGTAKLKKKKSGFDLRNWTWELGGTVLFVGGHEIVQLGEKSYFVGGEAMDNRMVDDR